jgi:hypothetical protein
MKRILLILAFVGTCNFAYLPGIVYPSTIINNAIINNMTVQACSPCAAAITVSHNTSDGVSPVTVDITYPIVSTEITGECKCWIAQNLGATQQATSATDNTDASAGWYWQFNLKQGYAVGPSPAWTITSISEDSNWTAAQDPCALLLGAGVLGACPLEPSGPLPMAPGPTVIILTLLS